MTPRSPRSLHAVDALPEVGVPFSLAVIAAFGLLCMCVGIVLLILRRH